MINTYRNISLFKSLKANYLEMFKFIYIVYLNIQMH